MIDPKEIYKPILEYLDRAGFKEIPEDPTWEYGLNLSYDHKVLLTEYLDQRDIYRYRRKKNTLQFIYILSDLSNVEYYAYDDQGYPLSEVPRSLKKTKRVVSRLIGPKEKPLDSFCTQEGSN